MWYHGPRRANNEFGQGKYLSFGKRSKGVSIWQLECPRVLTECSLAGWSKTVRHSRMWELISHLSTSSADLVCITTQFQLIIIVGRLLSNPVWSLIYLCSRPTTKTSLRQSDLREPWASKWYLCWASCTELSNLEDTGESLVRQEPIPTVKWAQSTGKSSTRSEFSKSVRSLTSNPMLSVLIPTSCCSISPISLLPYSLFWCIVYFVLFHFCCILSCQLLQRGPKEKAPRPGRTDSIHLHNRRLIMTLMKIFSCVDCFVQARLFRLYHSNRLKWATPCFNNPDIRMNRPLQTHIYQSFSARSARAHPLLLKKLSSWPPLSSLDSPVNNTTLEPTPSCPICQHQEIPVLKTRRFACTALKKRHNDVGTVNRRTSVVEGISRLWVCLIMVNLIAV